MKSLLRLLPIVLVGLAGSETHAQSLAMQRHVIAGGGGSSAGGAFTLSGTVGQPDASTPLTGGAFSLTGGYWALPVAVQTPGAPHLSVGFSNGLVVVSWPLNVEGFVLDRKSTLNTGVIQDFWIQVPFPYQTNATHVFVTETPGSTGFYRLRHP